MTRPCKSQWCSITWEGTCAKDAKVSIWVLPRLEQRLHSLGDVRDRGQHEPHDHQPEQPFCRPQRHKRERGHEKRVHVGKRVAGLGLEIGGGLETEQSFFCRIRRCCKRHEAQQEGLHQGETGQLC